MWCSDEALRRALSPPAVTLVGASPGDGITEHLLDNLLREDLPFKGPIHLVNRRGPVIRGIRAAKSTADVPGDPGLAVMLISPNSTVEALEGFCCLPVGVVAYGAGAEAGFGDAERAIAEWSKGTGVPVFGPQSTGLVLPVAGMAAMAAPLPERLLPGGVALIMQSGALVTGALRALVQRGWGVHSAVSVGNGSAVPYSRLATYLIADPGVSVLGLYVETIAEPRTLLGLGKLSKEYGKPVVLMIGGRSDEGARVARSHTGGLATDRRLISALCDQAGFLEVSDPDELVWSCEVLASTELNELTPGGIGIAGPSGGGVIMMADAVSVAGAPLPPLKVHTIEALDRLMDETGHIFHGKCQNPFDMGLVSAGGAAISRSMAKVFAQDENLSVVGYVQTLGFPASDFHAANADAFLQGVAEAGKQGFLLIPTVPGPTDSTAARSPRAESTPVGAGAKEAAFKLRALWHWANRNRLPAAKRQLHRDLSSVIGVQRETADVLLSGSDALAFLPDIGIEYPKEIRIAATGEMEMGISLDYPVVAKSESGLPHRAQAGGVVLAVDTLQKAKAAVEYLLSMFGGCVSLAESVPHGPEYIVGFHRDDSFGPVIIFGSGGTGVGGDVEFRLLPVTIGELQALIQGYVTSESEVRALSECMLAVQDAGLANEAIVSLDLNPLCFGPTASLVALDIKVHAREIKG